MMVRTRSRAPKVQSPRELLREICAPHILPGENAETHETLRQALLSDLAPATPYETLLAEHLIALEWEALRHRRLRDSLLRAEFRVQAEGVFAKGIVEAVHDFEQTPESKDLAFDLVASDPERRETALAALAELEISVEEIMARTYTSLAKDLEPHERQIAEIETRRRKLREDFDRLKSANAVLVEDAEEVSE
ncbi:hypothetical protein GQE99_10175 [Maritimibacter sp. DP07]|uniref:Uncharacterized protein n=1 Tax=Maritimibacter harenae TaxID=2606218 RepID=A0A845M7A7_9RHOB|nr:hypothetical protein [Maritimibacter harenae]MZR13383.1 hypothetical protein [Maritimibacter harenae]